MIATQLDELAGGADLRAHDRSPAEQHVRFAGELTWRMHRHELIAVRARAHDLALARPHHEEGNDTVTNLDENVAAGDAPCRALLLEPRHFRVAERPKHQRPVGVTDRRQLPNGHGLSHVPEYSARTFAGS